MALVAEVNWATLTVAGAFALGAMLGTVATIKIVQIVFRVERKWRRDDELEKK